MLCPAPMFYLPQRTSSLLVPARRCLGLYPLMLETVFYFSVAVVLFSLDDSSRTTAVVQKQLECHMTDKTGSSFAIVMFNTHNLPSRRSRGRR